VSNVENSRRRYGLLFAGGILGCELISQCIYTNPSDDCERCKKNNRSCSEKQYTKDTKASPGQWSLEENYADYIMERVPEGLKGQLEIVLRKIIEDFKTRIEERRSEMFLDTNGGNQPAQRQESGERPIDPFDEFAARFSSEVVSFAPVFGRQPFVSSRPQGQISYQQHDQSPIANQVPLQQNTGQPAVSTFGLPPPMAQEYPPNALTAWPAYSSSTPLQPSFANGLTIDPELLSSFGAPSSAQSRSENQPVPRSPPSSMPMYPLAHYQTLQPPHCYKCGRCHHGVC